MVPALLGRLRDEPFLDAPPPKSTGRDLFNEAWLSARLRGEEPRAVQATLLEFTARCVADACKGAARVIVCGGGTGNGALMRRLAALLDPVPVESSAAHGLDPSLVEAAAFAWLAERTLSGAPGNLRGSHRRARAARAGRDLPEVTVEMKKGPQPLFIHIVC